MPNFKVLLEEHNWNNFLEFATTKRSYSARLRWFCAHAQAASELWHSGHSAQTIVSSSFWMFLEQAESRMCASFWTVFPELVSSVQWWFSMYLCFRPSFINSYQNRISYFLIFLSSLWHVQPFRVTHGHITRTVTHFPLKDVRASKGSSHWWFSRLLPSSYHQRHHRAYSPGVRRCGSPCSATPTTYCSLWKPRSGPGKFAERTWWIPSNFLSLFSRLHLQSITASEWFIGTAGILAFGRRHPSAAAAISQSIHPTF